MKKSMTFRWLRSLVLLAGCAGYATAAPYPPEGRETSWKQPDGGVLALRVFGDEYYARTENTDGFTVVRNPQDGAYYFAELSADGSSLVPSSTRADKPAPEGLVKHLDLGRARIREIAQAKRLQYDGDRDLLWQERVQAARKLRGTDGATFKKAEAEIQAAPITGNKKGLTILVQFPNDPTTSGNDPVDFPTTREKITRFCNEVGYSDNGNSGSVRDYFFDQSLGKLVYTQTVTQVVTMPRARDYYNYSDYPTNEVIRWNASRVLITDALVILKASGFDFTGLTTSGNRAVATNVFFAGPDSGVPGEGLWPQSWSLETPFSVGTASKPVFISNFQITNINTAAPVIGTFCHENGHMILGYPDIYASAPKAGEGVGEHCLMGSGNYLNGGRTPSPINGYFKDLVGWATVRELTPTEFRTVSLRSTGNMAYRIRKPGTATEFFMVENRGDGDKWAEYSNDKGIAVWHIDERVNGNNFAVAGQHYGVALEQADGQFNLENGDNRGDSKDLFDLETPRFNDATTPDASWWDGGASSFKVEVLTAVGPTIDVFFGSVPPNTIIVGSPNGGETIFPSSKIPIYWQANITGNVKIDLYKADVFQSVIAANEPNDGKYRWDVPGSLVKGADYSLRISSVTNAVPTNDLSDTAFAVNDAPFPANNALPHGWFKPAGTNGIWKMTKSVVFEGTHGLMSDKVGDGKTSAIAYRSNFKVGNVSFYMKVSSEKDYDVARFYIDGEEQVFKDAGSQFGLSGDSDWVYASFPVSAGNHTFKWTYEKDDSYPGLLDKAWLDGVTLPETTQEIAVSDPAGVDVIDDASATIFPATATGLSSRTRTFTIRNSGKADLFGLAVRTGGANKSDFTISGLQKTTLAPGESTTFGVVFNPSALGLRTASLGILSNDADESDFGITMQGTGLGVPLIKVSQPGSTALKDGKSTVGFGFQFVGTAGAAKTFTIRNDGASNLSGLSISKSGVNGNNFVIGKPLATTLAPGESTTFTVRFKPNRRNLRTAEIHIASNDRKTGVFDISVKGKGAPRQPKASAASADLASLSGFTATSSLTGSPVAGSTSSVEVIGGEKFQTLTVIKQPGAAFTGTVEVSSNLLDWYSGAKHTTVLIDNRTTLKVRDNTPVSPDAKRHIRLR
ncbi:MAG: M6 family metalloprotease domain-containing protein [Verrucomicrobiota bacterium]